MTWTYLDSRLVPRDEVRFYIGDTDTTDQQLSDEDIAYLLLKNKNLILRTSWRACEAIMGKLAKRYNESIGPLNDDNPTKFSQYERLRDQLKERSLAEEGSGGLQRIGSPVATGTGPTYLGPMDEPLFERLPWVR